MNSKRIEKEHEEMLAYLKRIAKTNIGRPSQLVDQFEAFQEEIKTYLKNRENETND